ncbi:MAG: hypothetical protein AMS18_11520 [Gemmatimonas sp. SG8_17]|nr:MAG: hypothetical protein AMS18_11520 [Gemmatimonas sp. SG8_17]
MVRTIVSYSIMAVVGVVALKLVFGLLGFVFSLLSSLFWLAAIGFVIYVVLKVISPETASRIKETVRGKEKASD